MYEFRPNLIIVIINFKYGSKTEVEESGSQRSHKGTPNEIRRAFLGLDKGSPNVPKKLREETNPEEDIIYPIHFSLIKKPIKINLSGGKFRLRNTAVGTMILYEYLGLSQKINKFLETFDKFLKDLFKPGTTNYSESVGDYQIVVGKDWSDIRE